MSHDETRASRGGWYAPLTTQPSVPAIYQTTAFDVDGLEQLDDFASGLSSGHIYTRDSNPNHEAFAADLAGLEATESAVVCSSGMGAIAATLMSRLGHGDHVLAARVLYGRTTQLLTHLEERLGISVTLFDATRPEQIPALVRPETRICLVESISNPLMEVADIPAIVSQLGSVPLFVDSTFATPVLQKPIELGATWAFHSASKYLNGHGDVMMGVVAGREQDVAGIRTMVSLFGMNTSPLESWLASRGMRTLGLRMQRVCENAQRLADVLQAHSRVRAIYYPGLPGHPTHATAGRMLPNGYGGMISFELQDGVDGVRRLFRNLGEIPFSPTLADTRTTVSYPAGTSHRYLTAAQRSEFGITDGLVRLSVGIEAADDLELELLSALDR